jgi:hypothetical protein
VLEAGEICTSRYLTRTRVEGMGTAATSDDRLMVDACSEPRLAGYPTCPLEAPASGSKECCRRMMVLQGSYKVILTDVDDVGIDGEGRLVDWRQQRTVVTPWGSKIQKATLVADPCHTLKGASAPTCDYGKMHKLWQIAAPAALAGKDLYPDCSPDGTPIACNCSVTPVGHCAPTGDHVRELVVTVASALVTTNGSYEIDVRWDPGYTTDEAPFDYDPDFDGAALEAQWDWVGGPTTDGSVYFLRGSPTCYATDAPQRSDGTLTDAMPLCPLPDDVLGHRIFTYFGPGFTYYPPPSGIII